MAVVINVPPVGVFDAHGDQSNASERWKRWLRSFERYATASGCADPDQKKDLLLHCAGIDVQDIFDTLVVDPVTYETTVRALTDYFTPMTNTSYSRHIFRQEKQKDGETVAQFATRLRTLAKTSFIDFSADNINDFIRDQIIDACKSRRLRTKLLAQRELNLKSTLEIAQAMEASERQATEMAKERSTGDDKAYAIKKGNNSKASQLLQQRGHGNRRGKPHHPRQSGPRQPSNNSPALQAATSPAVTSCSRCGQRGHSGDECRCSRKVTCFKCNRLGHFAVMCRSKNKPAAPQNTPAVRFVHTDSDASDEYAFSLGGSVNTVVNANGVSVEMIIDSGATCNIVNSKIADSLIHNGASVQKCNRKIHPYGSTPISCDELIRTKLSAGNCTEVADLLVIKSDAPALLGKTTAEALGLLTLRPRVDCVRHATDSISKLLEKYPGIDTGIGCYNGGEVMLHIDRTVPPVARKHSRVPFHLRTKVQKELNKLLDEDIIEQVTGPTEWVSRIVTPPKPKNPNEIRVCVDMREANVAIKRTRHVTPTLDELVSELKGATVFSKIDLRSGYHQLRLHESCRDITTFSTHAGLYRYKRLNFGVSSASEVFQHTIQTVIGSVKGAKNISDDIIIHGATTEEHDISLDRTLAALHSNGLTINLSKCEFRLPKIEFFGYVFSADGLSPDPKKVQDLKEMSEPKSAAEVRSFLGMAQYSARFIKNFATLSEPLRQLTKQGSTWSWGLNESKAFTAIKDALSDDTTTRYFDPTKFTEIAVDASPVGLGAILTQESKPIAYASRALSDTEKRYSQTEREALAVIWACEHFNIYVSGAPFRVITDHQPLVTIWKKPNPPARIARWALRIQPYDVSIEYRRGADNPADFMSRHPSMSSNQLTHASRIAENYVNFLANSSTPNAITYAEVRTESIRDPTICAAVEMIRSSNWHQLDSFTDADIQTLASLRSIKNELTVTDDDVLLRDCRLVLPATLHTRAIELAHEGHQGITKTKTLLRNKVWFPGIDTMTENILRKCIPCQANSNVRHNEPLNMSTLPGGPWRNLSIDFCGPLPTGDYLLVIIDEYSRYPVVETLRSTSAEKVIPLMEKTFATFGYPTVIKTDNGPPFQSAAWKSFMQLIGVKHRKITPLWPQANAQAESFNKPLMKAIRAAVTQGSRWKPELQSFVRTYRASPHCSTLFSPHRLLFGWEPRTKIPTLISDTPHNDDVLARQNDAASKQIMKSHRDARLNAQSTPVNVGDVVLVKQQRANKFSTRYNPSPMVVTNTKGNMVTAAWRDGARVTRNSSHFHKMPLTPKVEIGESPLYEPELAPTEDTKLQHQPAEDTTLQHQPTEDTTLQHQPTSPKLSLPTPALAERPKRTVKRPKRLIEED